MPSETPSRVPSGRVSPVIVDRVWRAVDEREDAREKEWSPLWTAVPCLVWLLLLPWLSSGWALALAGLALALAVLLAQAPWRTYRSDLHEIRTRWESDATQIQETPSAPPPRPTTLPQPRLVDNPLLRRRRALDASARPPADT